jgi:hypothetical protein
MQFVYQAAAKIFDPAGGIGKRLLKSQFPGAYPADYLSIETVKVGFTFSDQYRCTG